MLIFLTVLKVHVEYIYKIIKIKLFDHQNIKTTIEIESGLRNATKNKIQLFFLYFLLVNTLYLIQKLTKN